MPLWIVWTAILLLWMSTLLSLLKAEVFSVSVPNSVSAALGSSVILRCELSPSYDAKTLEVRWYRNQNYDNPILLYQNLKVQKNNRVSLIGELEKGNVSLKVENLTLADRGEYVCLVKSAEWFDEASLNLNITVAGTPPLLLLAERGEQVNVTCVSDGWSPNPTLIWRDKRGNKLRATVDHHTDSEGLVSVSSWVLFSPSESEWISCSVGLSDQEMKEGRVLPPSLACKPDPVNATDSTIEPGLSPGWKAFAILLVISLLVFTVMAMLFIPKIRDRISPKDPKPASTEEQTGLVGESSPPPYAVSALREISRTDGATQTPVSEKNDKGTITEKETEIPDWEKMISCKVAITPVETTVYHLEIGEKRDRVTCSEDIEDKTQFVHALCKEKFRSGRYYWEITSLTQPYIETYRIVISTTYICPTSWYVGVTSKSAEKKRKVPVTPQNGYWVLQYDKDKGYYVNDPSLTPVLVRGLVSKLGVFIDCEKHTLSFYDCDKQTHLYTFYNVPSTSLIPVLSPGDKKFHTISICQ